MFQNKVVKKIKTHILCSVIFLKSDTVCEVMWKLDRPQMTMWYGACALDAGLWRLQTHTQNM